ncbi:N-acetylglucosamine-6-phosphate deacetylase [Lacrimispora sp.]|uniref:N-acetylglucosamine-6-phosphate deacetylase n=1 Tax=Lacrimispora sp. TaxID=2719234 RepID=UPI0028AD8F4D|nr:amidohydrolase family protein [Lacrimispora sp.]
MIVKSRRIYMEDGLKDGFLVVEDGTIKEFLPRTDNEEIIDYGDMRIIPGIFDTHNHGTCGFGLSGEVTQEEIKGYLKGCASQGITNVFPTAERSAIAAVARAAKEHYEGASILGIHSEGPWLNRTGEKGVRTGWPGVSLETAKQMVSHGQGLLKLVAMAPEIPGIAPLAEYFLNKGVVLAMAHSDSNYEEAKRAYEHGFSVSTHTGNVMTGLHHRDVGGLGAALLNDKVDCEVICDGMHISLEMLEIFFRIKSTERFMMISDCTPFSGAPEGVYRGFEEGMTIHVSKDGFVLTDTGRLMGSSQPVLYGIGNLVEKLHMPMEKVWPMFSLNPSRKYGFERNKGSLKALKDADFVVINDEYRTIATYSMGKKVYDAKEGPVFNPDFLREWRQKEV